MAKYTHIIKGKFGLTDEEHTYSRVNVDNMFAALSDLNTMGAVKLWFYLTVRLNGKDSWDLSPKECAGSIGLKDDALRDAKKLMIKKGYLEDQGDENYIFHQVPKKVEVKVEEDKKVEWEF